MATTEFKLMRHLRNQHGYGVSLTKYVDGQLVDGFTLNLLPTQPEQDTYYYDLAKVTGFAMETE